MDNEKEKPSQELKQETLKPTFNSLSRVGRLSVRNAAFFNALSDIAREDTQKAPWKYPFYVSYMSVMLVLGWGGLWAVLGAATFAYLKLELNEHAKWANGKIKDAFTEASLNKLVEDNDCCFKPNSSDPKNFDTNIWRIGWNSTVKAWEDTKVSTGYFTQGVRSLFTRKPA